MPYKDPEKQKAYYKTYQATHPEKGLAHRITHRDEAKARASAWRLANPERKKANDAAWRKANPEKCSANNAAWRKANPERKKTTDAAYLKAHPEQGRAHWQRRRACKANASINDFTAAQWRDMQAAYDHRCVYCGKRRKGKLTMDHIQPLSKGGGHTLANIVPACKSCNSRKGARGVLAPVQPLLLL